MIPVATIEQILMTNMLVSYVTLAAIYLFTGNMAKAGYWFGLTILTVSIFQIK